MGTDTANHPHDASTRSLGSLVVPPLPVVARRAIPQVVDALVPLALFLIVNAFADVVLAMLAGLAWSAFAIARRVAASRQVPAIVLVGAALLLLRFTVVVSTGSAFLYFLQPTIGTALVALAFLMSTVLRRPLTRRFATDFLTLPRELIRLPHAHRFFMRSSVMWAVIGLANASVTYLLLVSLSSSTFAITQTTMQILVTVVAVGISILWFRKAMGRHHTIVVAPIPA